MQFRSINPFTGQIIGTYTSHDQNDADQIINLVYGEFMNWKSQSIIYRAKLLRSVADILLGNIDYYSASITLEMGKVIRESRAEVEKCARCCMYYSDNAGKMLHNEPLVVSHGNAYIRQEPLGVILAVMPWNFPFWQVFRFAAPALMAGNTCLLKHASNVPRCAMDIEQIFIKAGYPANAFRTLLISSGQVEHVIDHPKVAAVTLTGSELAGSQVASAAGRNLKKSVLELGGSDPFIVLEDADIEKAAETAVKARMINTGQSCIAAKRFIIQKSVANNFTKRFIECLSGMQYGDPMQTETDYGTLARPDLAREIAVQVRNSIDKGARVLYGKLPETIDSAYFPPMILTDLKPGMPANDEEIFGPVACFYFVETAQEAVEVSNQSQFGLGASVWTKSENMAVFFADNLECGAVYINQMMFSDPSVPFGGVKKSDYDRKLAHLGIREFTNQKTVWLA